MFKSSQNCSSHNICNVLVTHRLIFRRFIGEIQTAESWENLRPKICLGRHSLRLDDEIKMLSSRSRMGVWTGLIWLKMGQRAGFCEHDDEPLGWNFLTS
jgi:hypothetical protein